MMRYRVVCPKLFNTKKFIIAWNIFDTKYSRFTVILLVILTLVCRPPVLLWCTLWDTSWRSPSTRAMASLSKERNTELSTSCRRQRCQLHWPSPPHCPLARAWAGLGIAGQRWTCLGAQGVLCSVCVCVCVWVYIFMCKLYSCKICESSDCHINLYRINFIAPYIIIHETYPYT